MSSSAATERRRRERPGGGRIVRDRRRLPAIDREALEREYLLELEEARARARSGLLNFTVYTKPDFEVAWHNRLLCRELNAWCDGDTENLLILSPPRVGKSELVSRRMPAYMLGREPDLEFVAASHTATFAKRLNRDVQRVITSAPYRELFPGTTLNQKNRVTVADGSWLRNSEMFEVVGRKGYYLCAGVGGSLTGSGADAASIDDPFKDWKAAYSDVTREAIWEWFTSVLLTRLSKRGRTCVTHTRWHEDDLAGRILAWIKADPALARRWRVVVLRAIKEGTPDEHPDDPREPGEALWPERFPKERLERQKKLNPAVFVSLYQQNPSPPEGNIVKNAWWRVYKVRPSLTWFDRLVMSVDLPFKDRKGKDPKKARQTDYAVFQVWGQKGADMYLLSQARGRMGYTQQEATFERIVNEYRELGIVLAAELVEAAANGEALLDRLGKKIPGMVAIHPRGDKVSRAEAIAGFVQAGNCYIPDPSIAPWISDWLLEWAVFPAGANDDQVDGTTQAISWMTTDSDWRRALPEAMDADSVWMEDGKRLVSMGYG